MRLTIYSKPGCHLCDEMKAVVLGVIQTFADTSQFAIEEVDISSDPGLLEQYGLEIPVLLVDGKKVAKYRISERELKRALEGRQVLRSGEPERRT